MVHVVVIAIVLLIIFLQVKTLLATRRKLKEFGQIFPKGSSSYRVAEGNEENNLFMGTPQQPGENARIEVYTKNGTLQEIVGALNAYLEKNKGAASDFNLMRDVVERYTSAEEEQITILQPIPLYLGLMGTMVGIIIGIGDIAIAGDFSGAGLMESIPALMGCVSIAMLASLFGILFTTFLSWKFKTAKSTTEANKNRFYTWLQTALLPVLSTDTGNALALLGRNLQSFNSVFETNVERLNSAFQNVHETTDAQNALLKEIQEVDLYKLAQVNARVVRGLSDSLQQIDKLSEYIMNVQGFLQEVHNLNQQLGDANDRTRMVEQLGRFFQQEVDIFKERQTYINTLLTDSDSSIRHLVEENKEILAQYVQEQTEQSINALDTLQQAVHSQQESFETFVKGSITAMEASNGFKKLGDGMERMAAAIEAQGRKMDTMNVNINALISELTPLPQPTGRQEPYASPQEKPVAMQPCAMHTEGGSVGVQEKAPADSGAKVYIWLGMGLGVLTLTLGLIAIVYTLIQNLD